MEIVVNGFRWIIECTYDKKKLSRMDGTITLGITGTSNMHVYLYGGLVGGLRQKVLVHELVHVWMYSYGYYLSVAEEEFVCSFIDTYGKEIVDQADRLLYNQGIK